jgi:protein TonB
VAVVPPDPYPAAGSGRAPAIVRPGPSNPGAAGSRAPQLPDGGSTAPVPDRPANPQSPSFTPYEVAPEVTNVEQIRQALTREYPAVLRDAGIGGTVTLWFYVNDQGVVENTQVQQSSGFEELDTAAMNVGQIFGFTPAYDQNRPVAVWISIPITFQTQQ